MATYVWVIVHGGHQALYQGLQWSWNKVPILINRVHTSLSHVWLHLPTTTGTKHAGKYWCLGHSFLQKWQRKGERVKLSSRMSLSCVGFTEAYIKHNYIFDWRQPQHSCWALNPSSHISASWLWCLKCTLNYVSKAVDAWAVRIFLTALDFFLLPSSLCIKLDRDENTEFFLHFLDTEVVPYWANKQILSLNVPIFTHFEVRSLAKTLHLWW